MKENFSSIVLTKRMLRRCRRANARRAQKAEHEVPLAGQGRNGWRILFRKEFLPTTAKLREGKPKLKGCDGMDVRWKYAAQNELERRSSAAGMFRPSSAAFKQKKCQGIILNPMPWISMMNAHGKRGGMNICQRAKWNEQWIERWLFKPVGHKGTSWHYCLSFYWAVIKSKRFFSPQSISLIYQFGLNAF